VLVNLKVNLLGWSCN